MGNFQTQFWLRQNNPLSAVTKREICLMITDDNNDDDDGEADDDGEDDDDGDGEDDVDNDNDGGDDDDYKDNTSQGFFSINLLGKYCCDPHFTDMEI